MKKIMTLVCIIMLISTLTSCAAPQITGFSTNEKGELIATYDNGENKNFGVVTKSIISVSINDLGELITTYSDGTEENLGQISCENVWRERNDKIYILSSVNTKGLPSNSSMTYAILTFGKEVERIGTNGIWEKINYNGKTLYIESYKTTTDIKEITFNKENKIVYTNDDTYLYLYPNSQDQTVQKEFVLKNTKLISTGTNINNTWTRVELDGITFYCKAYNISDQETK